MSAKLSMFLLACFTAVIVTQMHCVTSSQSCESFTITEVEETFINNKTVHFTVRFAASFCPTISWHKAANAITKCAMSTTTARTTQGQEVSVLFSSPNKILAFSITLRSGGRNATLVYNLQGSTANPSCNVGYTPGQNLTVTYNKPFITGGLNMTSKTRLHSYCARPNSDTLQGKQDLRQMGFLDSNDKARTWDLNFATGKETVNGIYVFTTHHKLRRGVQTFVKKIVEQLVVSVHDQGIAGPFRSGKAYVGALKPYCFLNRCIFQCRGAANSNDFTLSVVKVTDDPEASAITDSLSDVGKYAKVNLGLLFSVQANFTKFKCVLRTNDNQEKSVVIST